MTRRVIPIHEHLPQVAEIGTARNYKSVLLGITLILLHLASIAFALTYF